MDIYRILEKLDTISSKKTLTEGQVKRSLEARAEQMSKADFVANASEYGMSAEEAAEFWINVNGGDEELDEARRGEEEWDAQALAQHKARLARERNRRELTSPGAPAADRSKIPAAIRKARGEEELSYKELDETEGKEIDYKSLEIDGIDYNDAPDFVDAYFSDGYYTDGTPLSDADLEELSSDYDLVHKYVQDYLYEGDMEEGNAFSGAVAKAKADGIQPGETITVGGKKYPVKESKKAKPDFLDVDKDGNKKESMKKAAADKKKGVAEGVSVIKSDYDLDQMVLTLDIEGQRKQFTYWDYDENFENAERRDVFDQLQQQPWYKGLDHPTKMEILDAAYRAIRGMEPAEYKPSVDDEPLDEQGVAEGLGKDIKRGLQGWGSPQDKPADIVKRNKAYDVDTAKKLRATIGNPDKHSPQGLQKRVLDRKLKGVAEAEKKPHPNTWHDVDPKLGRAVDKMSQAEKVKKGLAHPDTLKKKGVAEAWPGTPEYELRFGKPESASAFDKKKVSTGTVYTRKHKEEPEADDSDTPKKKGRPAGSRRALGAKGPSGQSKLLKGKAGLKEQDIDVVDRGEYDREGDMALNQVHQIADAVKELHSILDADANLPEWVQSKITKALDYIDTARDYLDAEQTHDREAMGEAGYSAKAARAGKDIGKPGKQFAKIAKSAGEKYGSKERGEKVAGAVLAKLRAKESVEEVAPPGAKAERMVKHIKKGYAKDGKLTDKEKSIAYATAWKAKKAGKVEEEGIGQKIAHGVGKVVKAVAPKWVEKQVKKDDNARTASKKAAVDKFLSHAQKAEKNNKKDVEETTVAGSVATSTDAPKKAKGGMEFGKGVYEGAIAESFEKKLVSVLNESTNLSISTDDQGQKSVSLSAHGADADQLSDLLKMAGLFSSEGYSRACPHCGGVHEGSCEQMDEALANAPDEQYADTETMVNTLSGGLNGPKSTGQTTGDIINRQDSRQGVLSKVDEVTESTKSRLWSLYKKIDK